MTLISAFNLKKKKKQTEEAILVRLFNIYEIYLIIFYLLNNHEETIIIALMSA